jgi:hypothetical protein
MPFNIPSNQILKPNSPLGEPPGNRTLNLLIKSQLLYQLS